MNIEKLKSEYSKYEKKYNLPNIDELITYFELEKTEEEIYLILRQIRKIMIEKVANAANFIEMLLNPVNLPRIYMAYVNTIDQKEKEKINKIYSEIAPIIVKSLESELEYNEEKEANLIKETLKSWKKVKEELISIIKNIQNPIESPKKSKDYFG